MAHEPAEKVDFRNCLVAPKPLPSPKVRRDVGLFQQFFIAKRHCVSARLGSPSAFILSPSMNRGHALQMSKKHITILLQPQRHLELLPTNPVAIFPTRDIPQRDEAGVDHPIPKRVQ